ncbi:Serine palmitoyltransferase 1 [Nosema bombycis CQ1]|uniref:serine C-palmitoyltransferase n=1 Tax=Nosema bombycis (strain CQ1 / CVCC 102059) TaxID=578461 RepID=R0KR48_NOSB1|nr:Serine palmitoyltransferase 1 [Nosema bombycis CQ1]|eukprot:EOB13211.1 Serine palmitoyltransferase 1 [Nosema bombycis CQ1]
MALEETLYSSLYSVFYKILLDPIESAKILMEILVLILILQFRVRDQSGVLKLPEHLITKLINEFEPEPLVDPLPPTVLIERIYNFTLLDLCNYDAFDLRNKFKSELKATVQKYGVGTCGPPTFFGTLDIHKELEQGIATHLNTESALLYSNYYACIQSVISCFCNGEDHVFYNASANEGILRGLYHSKAKSFEFTTVESLKILLEVNFKPKVRNYVILEGLSKNSGQICPLPSILSLKQTFPFRIILDESCAIPLLHPKGVCGFYGINIKKIEMIVGSFSNGLSSCGGFFAGDENICEYQKISSSSYVFSASLPAVFAKFNLLALKEDFNYENLRKNIKTFVTHFSSNHFEILSSLKSPLIIITYKNEFNQNLKESDLLRRVYVIKHHLKTNGIYIGINKSPKPSLRIVIKKYLEEEEVIKISKMVSKACEMK